MGVHTLVWCDTLTNLNRILDRQALREFALRVFQMSAEDSANLVDTPTASKLGPYCCGPNCLAEIHEFSAELDGGKLKGAVLQTIMPPVSK